MQEGKPSSVSRREFLRRTGIAGAALTAVPLLGGATTRPDGDKRPNIIFMMTDDQRADALSIAGNPIVETPSMDCIAREGVRFTNMFVTNSLCAPSRACFLTGTWSHTNGVTTNSSNWKPRPTFIDHLRRAGYHTVAIGKFHRGGNVLRGKFDQWLGYDGQGVYHNPTLLNFEGKQVRETGHMSDLLGDRAVEYLRQHRRGPFAMCLWFKAPHRDWQPAKRFAELYKDKPVPRPPSFDTDYSGKPSALKHTRMQVEAAKRGTNFDGWVRDYYRTIAGVDVNVGRVLKALDELGLAENTIVVFSSDNGFFLGEHHFFDKRMMYEPSIRVPLMVRWPAGIRGGQTREQMALNVDLAPTLLELAGVPVPDGTQGTSLAPILADASAKGRKSWYYRYYEYPGPHWVRPHRGVRTEQWKYIEWPAMKRGQDEFPAEFELYDLKRDPHEMQNLYGRPEHAERSRELRAEMLRLAEELGDKES